MQQEQSDEELDSVAEQLEGSKEALLIGLAILIVLAVIAFIIFWHMRGKGHQGGVHDEAAAPEGQGSPADGEAAPADEGSGAQ